VDQFKVDILNNCVFRKSNWWIFICICKCL